MVTKKIESSDGKSVLIKDEDSWDSWTFHHFYNVFRSLFLFFAFVNHSLEEYFFFVNLCLFVLVQIFVFCSCANLEKTQKLKGGNCKLDIFSTRHFTEFENHIKMPHLIFYTEGKGQKKFQMLIFPLFVFSRQKFTVVLCSSFCSYCWKMRSFQ